jgi:hypothetical protein
LPGASQEIVDRHRMEISLRLTVANGPFQALTEFRREALVAFWLTGDYRAVITWTATAAELLLDEVLQGMMWEERRRPEDCVTDFTGNMSIVKRVRNLYPSRLGGSWAIAQNSRGAVADWFTDITRPRNRIMHSGYRPSHSEAERALSALERLITYIGDLLVVKAANYPRTAWMLIGQDGFDRRMDNLPESVRKTVDDPSEVPWIETLGRWRACLSRCRIDRDVPRAPSVKNSYLYAIFEGDSVRWCLHDRTTHLAAEVDFDKSRLPRRMNESFDYMKQSLLEDAIGPQTVAHPVGIYDGAQPSEWLEEYRLIPMAGVMVDRTDMADIAKR